LDAGARHKIPDGSRGQHLLGASGRGDARAGVHGDAADLRSGHLAFAGMESRPDLEAELADRIAEGARAADRARRAIEDGEEAVARHVDLASTEALELPAGPAEVG